MNKWDSSKISLEEVKIKSNQLVDKVRELIKEGNARRVTIKKDGRTLLEFPLSVGVGGATAAIMFTPILAAVGALAALVSDVDVIVERTAVAEVIEENSSDDSETEV